MHLINKILAQAAVGNIIIMFLKQINPLVQYESATSDGKSLDTKGDVKQEAGWHLSF